MADAHTICCTKCDADLLDGDGRAVEPCPRCGSTAKTYLVKLRTRSEDSLLTSGSGLRARLIQSKGLIRFVVSGLKRDS
jgi:hypothetical protein